METLPLGKTGVEVSALCLGTAYYGTYIDREASFALLDQYFEAGGRFVDTANCYAGWVKGASGGESENTIGEWLRERGNRSEMFIATKVGIGYSGVKSGLSARQIEAECEKSLKRLGVETIDLYYAHRDDRRTRLEKTLETFDRLLTAGKVRFIGASNYRPWRLEETRWISETKGWAGFCCTQNHYTYLQPKPGAGFHFGTRGLDQEGSGVHCPSDTLFAALVAVAADLEGEAGAEAFVAPFERGQPPFLLSSAFPRAGSLPLLPSPLVRMELTPQRGQGKLLKRLRYVSPALFRRMLGRKPLDAYAGLVYPNLLPCSASTLCRWIPFCR